MNDTNIAIRLTIIITITIATVEIAMELYLKANFWSLADCFPYHSEFSKIYTDLHLNKKRSNCD